MIAGGRGQALAKGKPDGYLAIPRKARSAATGPRAGGRWVRLLVMLVGEWIVFGDQARAKRVRVGTRESLHWRWRPKAAEQVMAGTIF